MPVHKLAFLILAVMAAAGLTIYAALLVFGSSGASANLIGILSIVAMGTAVALRKAND